MFQVRNRNQIYRRVHELVGRLRDRLGERGLSAADLGSLSDFDWHAALESPAGEPR